MTTIDELKKMTCNTIVPAVAADVIGCDANTLREQARQRPDLLGFPAIVVGNRVKIPRLPFIQFMEKLNGGQNER